MRRSLFAGVGIVVAIAVVAIAAATSLGGGRLGQLVAKDTDKGDSAVAVAGPVTIQNPGKMSMKVTSKPRHQVGWNYTTDCIKDGKPFQYPPPGESQDTFDKTPIVKTLKTGGAGKADECTVVVSAKLKFKAAKRVTAKIYNK